jgi:hypothetical protein
MQKKESKNIGPIIGTLIIVIVLIVAALYVFASHINHQMMLNSENLSGTTTTIINDKSDDIQTLQNDLNRAIR